MTVYEVRSGLDLMPEGRRRQLLEVEFNRLLMRDLLDRVLPFDRGAAIEAGRLGATRRQLGFTDDHRDIQIAGIVIWHGATLVTRNVRHFAGLGMSVVDPWASDPA